MTATMNRADIYGSTVTATFTINPPKLRNTKFEYLRSIPIIGDLLADAALALCGPIIGGINSIISALPNWLQDAITFVTGNPLGQANYYKYCDDRPQTIDYTVNSMAIRIGWSPQIADAQNALGLPLPPGGINFVNAANATSANAGEATATIPSTQASGYSNLRFTLRDPTLLDGFLPLDDVELDRDQDEHVRRWFQG